MQASGKQAPVPAASKPRLAMATVFKGESKFHAIVAKAERENSEKAANWRADSEDRPGNGRNALRKLHAGGG